MSQALPLAGVKVLDLTWVIVGPSATRVLADYGATVVKVESATRLEPGRVIGPHMDRVPGPNRSACFSNCNAGKLDLALNLSTAEARDVVRRLARWADVLVESFTPKAMRNWGLSYDKLSALNPGLIYLSTSLLGQSGPYSQFAGYGNLGAALAGFNYLVGWPDRPPAGPAGAYTDYVAAKFITLSILAALDHRDRTGRGQHIDLAQAEAATHFLTPAFLDYEVNGRVAAAAGNRSAEMVPHGVFRCAGEDRWIAIAVQDESQWQALCAAMGQPELARDPRFASLLLRQRHEDELEAEIERWTEGQTPEQVEATLIAAGVPAHAVFDSRDALGDPHLAARGHFVQARHPELGEVILESSRIRLTRTPSAITCAGPTCGQDTMYVLQHLLGLSETEVAQLAATGALE